MKFEATTTDNGAADMLKLMAELERVDGAYVDVGLHDDGTTEEGGEYLLAEIGAVHEFGTKPGTVPHIPERSWLRSANDENEAKWQEKLDRGYDRILAGKGKVVAELAAFGELAASGVRKKITDLRDPPNAEITIERKGSSNPLIDTGAMRANVRSRIVAGNVEQWTPKGSGA